MNKDIKNNFHGQKLLLVDDDLSLLKLLTMRLQAVGLEVKAVESAEQAIKVLPDYLPQLVITDLRMNKMDGMEFFYYIQENYTALPVIILTAHGTIKEAVTATRHGLFGFLTKPVDSTELLDMVFMGLQVNKQRMQNQTDNEKQVRNWQEKIITRSLVMENLLNEVQQVSQTDVSVFIQGESGTGKELVARAIHQASPRYNKEFVAVNCSAIPEELLESELFGHCKGAFSGALATRKGLFEMANGGTLFLDEIGDMPLAFQVKLLRAIQEKEIRPVGKDKNVIVDVRVVSASHQNLKDLVDTGNFRMDLFYRLNVVTLEIPPLRERLEDIPVLIQHFIADNTVVKGFSTESMELMLSNQWPGNVRQLKNVIDHVCTFATTPLIPVSLVERALQEKYKSLESFTEAKKKFERDYLIKLLQLAKGSVSEAARLAKRNRTEFYKLLDRHQLKAAEFREK